MTISERTTDAVELLRRLVAVPSVSRDEAGAADVVEAYLRQHGLRPCRKGNNVWVVGEQRADGRPTVLLDAHIDTVRPAPGWKRDPFCPTLEGDRLYGLGTNDDGGSLVSLMQAFLHITDPAAASGFPSAPNLIFMASCEEEVSGREGIESVLPLLPPVDFAVVGEPTAMQPAVAEKGLMVIDVDEEGVSGHAARNEGVNAIYKAVDDIERIRHHEFSRVSPLLGAVKATVTIVNAGTQHNVVPAECRFTIDVRSNELYTNQELFDEISQLLQGRPVARSFRLGSSHIGSDHPIVRRAVSLGLKPFGSPTLSNQALMPFPSVKIGPGDSARSHTADEFICLSEIEEGIRLYIELLTQV